MTSCAKRSQIYTLQLKQKLWWQKQIRLRHTQSSRERTPEQIYLAFRQVANQLKSLPDQIINATQAQINTLASQFTQAAQEVATAAQGALDDHTSSMPAALYQALIDPSAESAAALQTHIDSIASDSANTVSTTTTNGKIAVDPGSQPSEYKCQHMMN